MAGHRDPIRAGHGRPKGSLNKNTRAIQEAARLLIETPEYQSSLALRLAAGKAPHMETLLHHYAYGKPKETHEHTIPEGVTIRHVLEAGQ